MKQLLLGLILLVTAGAASAEWVKIGENLLGTNYYDPTTIRVNGNLRRVWQVQDLKKRDKDGEMSRRLLVEYDCKEDRHRFLYASDHSGSMVTGNTLVTDDSTGKWDFVPPGTNAEYMLNLVCAKK